MGSPKTKGSASESHQALDAELGIGLLLPCNVCVWEDGGGSVVSIARPDVMFDLVKNDALRAVAQEADRRLRLALDQVKSQSRASHGQAQSWLD